MRSGRAVAAMLVTVLAAMLGPALRGVPAGASSAARDDVEMVEIPAGPFAMGSADAGADPDEQPLARLFVDTINLVESRAQVAPWVREHGLTFPVLLG